MDERRFTDEEVAEIFRSAALPAARERDLPARSGLTLAELQEIGREVGISADQIAQAAVRLDARPAVLPRGTVLGVPTSVGRTVDLPRAPTDREWSIIVGELREVFRAQGRENTSLDMRSWRNGNLRVAVEPTEAGYRLRMRTRKGNARASLGIGLVFVLMAIVLLLGAGGSSNDIVTSMFLALMGAGMFSYNAIQIPRWASERDEQMEYVASRMLALLSRPSAEASPPAVP